MSFSQVVPVDDEGTSGIRPSSKKPILRQHCINKQDTLSRITTTTEGQIESVFEKFDKNNDGSISSKEMALVQQAMSKEIGVERAHEVVNFADTNNDDILSKSEFLVMMHQFKREKVHRVKDDIKLFRENDALQKKVAVVTGGKCCAGQKQIFAHTLKSIFYQRTEALIVLTSLVTVACLYPLLNTTYTSKDHVQISRVGYMCLWGVYWLTWPVWAAYCYLLAFPSKMHMCKMALLVAFFCILGSVNVILMGCKDYFRDYVAYPRMRQGTRYFTISRSIASFVQYMVVYLTLFGLFHGVRQARHKAVFTVYFVLLFSNSIFLSSASFLQSSIDPDNYRIVVSVFYVVVLLVIIISARVHDISFRKKPDGIRVGGSRAYTALLALILPNVIFMFGNLSFNLFRAISNYPVLQVTLVLVFKLLVLAFRDVLGLIVSSSMPDDVSSVVVMFYPIFALQFYLEMMYLSVEPFTLSWFSFLFIKLFTGMLAKGLHLIHWMNVLHIWSEKRLREGAQDLQQLLQADMQVEERRRLIFRQRSRRLLSNCLTLSARACVALMTRFMSNTGRSILHDLQNQNPRHLLVRRSIVQFILITMSNVSSIACCCGAFVILAFDWAYDSSVWNPSAESRARLVHGYLVLLAANILVVIYSSYRKNVRWQQLKVFIRIYITASESLWSGSAGSSEVFHAKEKVIANVKRKRLGNSLGVNSDASQVTAAELSEAVANSLFHETEREMNLHRLEHRILWSRLPFLLFVTFYLTMQCASYGAESNFINWMWEHNKNVTETTNETHWFYTWHLNSSICD